MSQKPVYDCISWYRIHYTKIFAYGGESIAKYVGQKRRKRVTLKSTAKRDNPLKRSCCIFSSNRVTPLLILSVVPITMSRCMNPVTSSIGTIITLSCLIHHSIGEVYLKREHSLSKPYQGYCPPFLFVQPAF